MPVTEIRRLTEEQMASFGCTVAELRQLAREHGVLMPRDALHHEAVRALTAAGVKCGEIPGGNGLSDGSPDTRLRG
jgi:hypothetical protein